MQTPSPDTLSVSHQGVRYVVARPGVQDTEEGARRLRTISLHLEAAMRKAMSRGETPNPQDPDWLRDALSDCDVSAGEVDDFLELMALQAAVAPVMMRITQRMVGQTLAQAGLPSLEAPELRQALEQDGALTPQQIDRVLNDITGPFGSPRSGGSRAPVVAAYLEATGEKLWEQPLCQEQDVQITSLTLEGEALCAYDSRSRVHRIPLGAHENR